MSKKSLALLKRVIRVNLKNNGSPLFHVALVEPEIPQNTGNIGRLTLGLNVRLHLVHPLGFSLSEKAVRRAGLDYWKNVDVQEHKSIDDFLEWAFGKSLVLFSTKAIPSYRKTSFEKDCVLVFGPESRGLSTDLRERFPCVTIPMSGPIRSLNLSNAVAVASYEAYHQIHG
ncbi:MAG: tRNA (uridine(34)/cytosine(34)/5-carboxymethylaminomethyluridine(34)-2'-O)-methyltransferase TrmL [Deltaproteobacteria bacterium]|nr:tRNA (uridine(34)/cytosine(34)/5-carboxymethylaminomethyluridine(34)-2'-O)-methyltransferase TrmL [Deltaproteobacteria bacterium]